LTRTAALHIAASSDSEVQIRSSEIGPGFPVKIVDLPDAPAFYVPGIAFVREFLAPSGSLSRQVHFRCV